MDNHSRYLFVEETSLKGNAEITDDLPIIEFTIGTHKSRPLGSLLYVTIKQGTDDSMSMAITNSADINAFIKGFSFIVDTLEKIKNS